MKFLFVFAFFSITSLSFASEKLDSQKVTFSKDKLYTSIHLESDEYKDIYEWQTVDAYCEKEVWNYKCSRNDMGWNCTPSGTCSPSTYDVCYDTEKYRCEKTEHVFVRREFVKTHIHDIDIKIDKALNLKESHLEITVKAEQKNISLKLENSYPENLIKFELTSDDSKKEVTIVPVMTKEKALHFKDVELSKLRFKGGEVSFIINEGEKLKDFLKVSELQIEKRKLFMDEIIYKTPYRKFEQGGESKVIGSDLMTVFTCKNSNIPCITKGKYDVFVTAKINLPKSVLNIKDFLFLQSEVKAEALKVRP